MVWTNWLRSEQLLGNTASDSAPADKDTHNLDMKQVIDAHRTWVACLHDLIHLQIDRTFDFPHKHTTPPFLLRQWLYGPARKRYGKLFEYRALSSAHEKFHECSDTILHCHQGGLKDHARLLLEDELPVYSENVQMGIVRLYAAAAQKY